MERMGLSRRGPLLSSISKGTPIPGKGVRMSLNKITPSGRKLRKGWGWGMEGGGEEGRGVGQGRC